MSSLDRLFEKVKGVMEELCRKREESQRSGEGDVLSPTAKLPRR
jgi:hypothetical protein